jgi:HEAT repeat protein
MGMAKLQEYFKSPDQSIRLKAALAAGTYPEAEFIEILIHQCSVESDFFVRDTLSWALMRQEREAVMELLKTELNSPISQARSQALHTLSKIGDKANYALITNEHLLDDEDLVASTAWRAASVLVPDDKKSELAKKLVTQLGRGDGDTQFGLTRFLCAIGEPIVKPLEEAAKSENENVRVHADITLIRFKELQLEFKKLQSK